MSMSTEIRSPFPQRLQTAREMRSLNQEELAKLAGLQPSAISHFETEARKPSFENLKKLADALEVTVDYLMGRVDSPNQFNEAGDAIFRDFSKLSSEDRQLAREFMASLAKRSAPNNN